jgi:hypothetical protein
MDKERVTLSKRKKQRARVLVQILDGRLVVPDAARLVGLSIHRVQRLLAKVHQHGLAALPHGNRGHPSPRWFPFPVQVCLKRTGVVARQMDRVGMKYVRQGNCFLWVEDWGRAQRLLDVREKRRRSAWISR